MLHVTKFLGLKYNLHQISSDSATDWLFCKNIAPYFISDQEA